MITRLTCHIRQSCAAAILRVLEQAASTGVTCRLLNIRNQDVKRLLFPKLAAMNMDQPEAQKFFGLQNKTSCSKCRRRTGYSAFRKSSTQHGAQVHRLYSIANNPQSPFQKNAQSKLKRWGFNYERRCCLTDVCDKLLARLPGKDEVYPCLDYRDSLHGLGIFIHRVVMEALAEMPLAAKVKRILDQRLAYIGQSRFLREPSGKTYRVQRTIFGETGMTAKDRCCVLFMLPHVLGPTAGILHERLRLPILTAIARAQLMIISTRGLRQYTECEFREIFDRGFVELFGALEFIRECNYTIRNELHDKFPGRWKVAKKFSRKKRLPCSDTDDTDARGDHSQCICGRTYVSKKPDPGRD